MIPVEVIRTRRASRGLSDLGEDAVLARKKEDVRDTTGRRTSFIQPADVQCSPIRALLYGPAPRSIVLERPPTRSRRDGTRKIEVGVRDRAVGTCLLPSRGVIPVIDLDIICHYRRDGVRTCCGTRDDESLDLFIGAVVRNHTTVEHVADVVV